MAGFYAALVVGAVVALAYLALVFIEFRRVRRHYADGGLGQAVDIEEPEGRHAEGGFSWIAGAGVLASLLLLVLASVWGWTWYLLPILSIGTAVAVIVAFITDRQQGENR